MLTPANQWHSLGVGMNFRFANLKLQRLNEEPGFKSSHSAAIVSAFRKRVQQIAAAVDTRDLAALHSLRFKPLQGDRSGEYSLRLNDQWRLIVKLEGEGVNKTIVIIDIEDYH